MSSIDISPVETKKERRARRREAKRLLLEKKSVESSMERSNVVFRPLYFWLDPLVSLGNYTTVTESHVPEIPQTEHCEGLAEKFEPAWEKEMQRDPVTPSVFRVLWGLHWKTYMVISFYEGLHYGLNFLTPYVIQWIATFFKDMADGVPRDLGDGILYSFLLALLAWAMSLSVQVKFFQISLLGSRLRSTLMSVIFRKALTVDPDALKTTTTGETMNLMSNDAQRMNEAVMFGAIAWSSPTVIIIAMILLYLELGVAAFAAIGLMFLLFPYQMYIAKLIRKTRGMSMKLTDQRVKLVNEMLQGIRVIKLYAWEEAVAETLSRVRRQELWWTRMGLIVRMLNQAVLFVWPTVVTIVTMVIYTKLGNDLTETKVLLMLSFLNVARFPIGLLPVCLSVLVEMFVATGRISKYLGRPDLPLRTFIGQVPDQKDRPDSFDDSNTNGNDNDNDVDLHENQHIRNNRGYNAITSGDQSNNVLNGISSNHRDLVEAAGLSLGSEELEMGDRATGIIPNATVLADLFSIYTRDTSFRWTVTEGAPAVLTSISLAIVPGSLTAVIGPVGAGKSSLIAAILGEMHTYMDTQCTRENPDAVLVRGKNVGIASEIPGPDGKPRGRGVGYLAQDPWIVHGSLKDNILLGLALVEERLQWAIDVSALRSDLAILPDGLDTAIGDSGVNLSGGQKARVAMARLMYRADEIDVCLLDDPLSAVDMGVGKHIFEKCVLELRRRGKTVILTLNSHLHVLHDVDSIIVIDSISSVQPQQQIEHNDENHTEKDQEEIHSSLSSPPSNTNILELTDVVDMADMVDINLNDDDDDTNANGNEKDINHAILDRTQQNRNNHLPSTPMVGTDETATVTDTGRATIDDRTMQKTREPSTIIAHGSYHALLSSNFDFSKYEQQLEMSDEHVGEDDKDMEKAEKSNIMEDLSRPRTSTTDTANTIPGTEDIKAGTNVPMSFIKGVNASAIPTSLATLTTKHRHQLSESFGDFTSIGTEQLLSPHPKGQLSFPQKEEMSSVTDLVDPNGVERTNGEFSASESESEDELSEQDQNEIERKEGEEATEACVPVEFIDTERSANFMDGGITLSRQKSFSTTVKRSVKSIVRSRTSSRGSRGDSESDTETLGGEKSLLEPSKSGSKTPKTPDDDRQARKEFRKTLGKEVNATGGIAGKTYLDYFSGGMGTFGTLFKIGAIILTSIICQGLKMLVDYWILWWAEDSPETALSDHSLTWWKNTTGYWVGGLCLALFLRSVFFIWTAIASSQHLHDSNFANVLSAPMSWFDVTPLGQVVNRFSKDIDIIDAMLPDGMVSLLQQLLLLFGIVVTACISSYYFVIPMIPIALLVYLIQKHFRNASTQLKRLEGSTFSPVYASFGSATRGAGSIRAFGLESQFISRHDEHINRNAKIFLTYQLLQRWLAFRLDALACIYIFFVGFVSVMVRESITASAAGLAVVYAMQMTGSLQFTVRQQIVLQGFFTAVERINHYQTLPTEDIYSTPPEEIAKIVEQKHALETEFHIADLNALNPVPPSLIHAPDNYQRNEMQDIEEELFLSMENARPKNRPDTSKLHDNKKEKGKNKTSIMSRISIGSVPVREKLHGWPWMGGISFEDITMAYRPDLPLVISGLTFKLPPGKKVGVVGRTGAGKSSLLLILFRMVELVAGRVVIDGVDTKHVGIGDLRSRMSIIPQQPVLFSGTVRYNLDPFGHHSDDEIYLALERVNMLDAIQSMESGLLSHVAEFGSNFSQGQRQLLCIARALLRSNPIIVLDEATAAVDPATDAAIQKTIKDCFSHCSIMTIAHRLDTIVDYDYVLVLGPIDGDKASAYRRSKAIDPDYEYPGNPEDIFSMREFDSPYTLLTSPSSVLYKMTKEGGEVLHSSLVHKAKMAHFARQGIAVDSSESPDSAFEITNNQEN